MKNDLIKKIVQQKMVQKKQVWCGPGTCVGG